MIDCCPEFIRDQEHYSSIIIKVKGFVWVQVQHPVCILLYMPNTRMFFLELTVGMHPGIAGILRPGVMNITEYTFIHM